MEFPAERGGGEVVKVRKNNSADEKVQLQIIANPLAAFATTRMIFKLNTSIGGHLKAFMLLNPCWF
jgi:hypothetical protein